MLKLSISDILKQKLFGSIAIISGFILGILYYFLTLEMAISHISTDIELIPIYIITSISLTTTVAILAGINIALVAYNIKIQQCNSIKKYGMSTF